MVELKGDIDFLFSSLDNDDCAESNISSDGEDSEGIKKRRKALVRRLHVLDSRIDSLIG